MTEIMSKRHKILNKPNRTLLEDTAVNDHVTLNVNVVCWKYMQQKLVHSEYTIMDFLEGRHHDWQVWEVLSPECGSTTQHSMHGETS